MAKNPSPLSLSGRCVGRAQVKIQPAVASDSVSRGPRAEAERSYAFKIVDSPVGRLKLIASDKGLSAILWEHDDPRRIRLRPLIEDVDHPILEATEQQLAEYFRRKRKTFTMPLDFKGTDFQRHVWEALLTIPFGETRSYGEIARQIGRPAAFRAVGAANGKNPIAIIAPCHRVIGSTGGLTGFAGGLEAKEHLLGLESSTVTCTGREIQTATIRPARATS